MFGVEEAVRRTILAKRSIRLLAVGWAIIVCLAAAAAAASAQTPVQPSGATARTSAPVASATIDLQGLWDFTMHIGNRTSTGFFALGPIDGGWAGSLTPDSTNTLAIRHLTIYGDSFRMVVASREGDVPFYGKLSADARSMEGMVDYHGGRRYPMTATRRLRRSVP